MTASAGFPPSVLKGEAQSTSPTTFNFITPNNQSTQVAGIRSRIETGSKNLLNNASFEHQTLDTGFSFTGGGTSAASTTNLQDGARSLTRTSTGVWTVIQDSTLYAASKSGQEAEVSVWVYSITASADLWLCPRVNGASVTTSVANGCMQYTQLGLPQKLTIFPLFGGTSTGFEVKGAGAITYILDDAYLGDRRPTQLGVTTTPWTDVGVMTITAVSGGAVKGATAIDRIMSSRVGQNIKANYQYRQTGAGTAGTGHYLFSLPTGLTFDSMIVPFTGAFNAMASIQGSLVGTGQASVGTNQNNICKLVAYSTTQFRVVCSASGGVEADAFVQFTVSSSSYQLSSATAQYNFLLDAPIAEWAADTNAFTTRCDDPRNCETVFSAKVSSAGVVSGENLDWLEGNAALSDTSLYAFTFKTAVFSVAPNCFTTPDATTASLSERNVSVDNSSASSSNVSVRTVNYLSSKETSAFNLYCQKQGADYTNSRITQQIVQMRGVPTVPGASGGIDTFSFGYGTTDARTNCTASPCFVDQIGTAMVSVIRNGTGNYNYNTVKTYLKLKCSGNNSTRRDMDVAPCSNCSGSTMNTVNDSGSLTDSFGVITCQGSY